MCVDVVGGARVYVKRWQNSSNLPMVSGSSSGRSTIPSLASYHRLSVAVSGNYSRDQACAAYLEIPGKHVSEDFRLLAEHKLDGFELLPSAGDHDIAVHVIGEGLSHAMVEPGGIARDMLWRAGPRLKTATWRHS